MMRYEVGGSAERRKEGRGVCKWQTGARNSTVRDAADGADGAVSPERL
jgi:hypothetical protein